MAKVIDDKIYRCTILGEDVKGRVCESRRMKANIARHNPRFRHRMTPHRLKGCSQCREEAKGLVGI